MKNLLIMTLSILVLTGCINREQADAKLAKACLAGAEVFLEDGYEIKEMKNRTFGEHTEFGSGYREVRVTALESDGWYETDKEYKCIFAEQMGPFGLSYNAEIYQLEMDDQLYGKKGNMILGSMNDFVKLGNAVSDALGR